jgi:hypothetical protein
VSVDEVLAYGDLAEDRVDGRLIQTLISSAERFAARYTRRQFAPLPALVSGVDSAPAVTKTFTVRPGRITVSVPDLRAVTSVSMDGMLLDTYSGYLPVDTAEEPATFIQLFQPYGSTSSLLGSSPSGVGALAITGRWGWNPIPDDVKVAVMALTMRMYKERKALWGDTVLLPDGAIVSYFKSLPASVQAGLNTYRKVNLAIV